MNSTAETQHIGPDSVGLRTSAQPTALEDGDSSLLAAALGDIARGMSRLAEDSGMTREALYKALRPGAKPRFDTIAKVRKALGVKLHAEPV